MNFFKLITNNVLRSTRIYGGYFLSSTFSVFVFFLFSILNFHPQLKNGLGGSSGEIARLAQIGMSVSQVLIVALSFIFLWYSFGIFSKSRKRELSVYVMLGIKPRDLRKLLFGENMVIGTGAIVTGITIGILFMKAILIIVQNILSLTTGLNFYFPTFGILLTVGIYFLLFLLVSFFLTLKIETANLTLLGKSDDMPEKTPKANPFFVLLAFISLGLGYGSLVSFVKMIDQTGLLALLSCVFFTVIATFLFFHQVSIYYYLWKQKSAKYWQGKRLLLTTTGAYRGKENANFFALITCTAAVALVGVSVTASLGSMEANTRNSLPVAIVIDNNYDQTQISEAKQPILQLGAEIVEKLKKANYNPVYETFNLYQFEYFIENRTAEYGEYVSAIAASDYNRVAQAFGLDPLHPKENEILIPAANLADAQRIEEDGSVNKIEVEGFDETLTSREVATSFRLMDYQKTVVVTDAFLAKLLAFNPDNYTHINTYQFIDYKGWNDGSQVNKEIVTELSQRSSAVEKAREELSASDLYDKDPELYSKKWDEIFNTQAFNLKSLYSQYLQKRQANGFILMIGLLIGGVFFLFASSILYFRLFGDLDKEGRFHRSLYQIGLTPKMRHKIITRQLLTMYFLPMSIATLHSAVAFWGIVQLAEVNLWHYFLIIIAVYFIFQLLLFMISRWRYLAHLDLRAENPQAF
ncbi:FtsX-like permease family protein [Enterococcus sp. LJL98]